VAAWNSHHGGQVAALLAEDVTYEDFGSGGVFHAREGMSASGAQTRPMVGRLHVHHDVGAGWHVGLQGEMGAEEQGFLILEGRTERRLAARLRASNYPHKRFDGANTPDLRGVLETDDGVTVLFEWRGYGLAGGRLVGSLTHLTGESRYQWLNPVVCAGHRPERPERRRWRVPCRARRGRADLGAVAEDRC